MRLEHRREAMAAANGDHFFDRYDYRMTITLSMEGAWQP